MLSNLLADAYLAQREYTYCKKIYIHNLLNLFLFVLGLNI